MFEDIDKAQIGRYGTISLLKRQDPSTVITSFGIDTQELTFGRDRQCGVRLYYPDIDPIHCKIIFEERKAFLVVLGKHGLLVDGCLVYPNPSVHGTQTVVPLTNNSEIEIHNKRFRFAYPPKELRSMLFASPIRRNRALRLSMVHSAQVFSPQLARRPEDNLRVLRTPLKSTFLRSPVRPSSHGHSSYQNEGMSPVKSYNSALEPDLREVEEEEEDEDVVLVEGDHPRIVEEETDLVILEDVEVPPPTPCVPMTPSSLDAKQRINLFMNNPPQTPRRRPNSRDSLHRAVLIRSAQRSALRGDKEDDELEEMEVLSVVASDDGFELAAEDEWDGRVQDGTSENDENEEFGDRQPLGSTWNVSEDIWAPRELATPAGKSRNRLLDFNETQDEKISAPLGDDEGSTAPVAEGMGDDVRHLEDGTLINEPIRRRNYVGSFMTPQRPTNRKSGCSGDDLTRGTRYSVGGGEPRRMLVEMPWRVKDLVVPLKAEQSHNRRFPDAVAPGMVSSEFDSYIPQSATPRSTRKLVDEQERKAIQERRRSALRGTDTFFVGGIPGMGVSPTKNIVPHRRAIYPSDAASESEDKTTVSSLQTPILAGADKEEDELDTRSLLERMKVTVEEMKRRRSTTFAPSSCLGEPESAIKFHSSPIAAMDDEDAQGRENGVRGLTGGRSQTESSPPLVDAEQEVISTTFTLQNGLPPKVVIGTPQKEQMECAIEKSFSQLMRSESPQESETQSDEICNILERDIVIPSENALDHPTEPSSLDIPERDSYAIQRRTRGRSRTTSSEPETGPLARQHGAFLEYPIAVSTGIPSRGGRGGQAEQDALAELRELSPTKREQKEKIDLQALAYPNGLEVAIENTDQQVAEEECNLTPVPASRTRTGARGRTVVSAASHIRSLEKDKGNESEEEGRPGTFDRRSKVSKTRDSRPNSRGRPRKAKEEGHETAALTRTRDSRKRSATESKIEKTPATRSSARRTPATAPSVVSASDARGEKQDVNKENAQSLKIMPEEGSRVRITRNKAAHSTAAAATSQVAHGVKSEETVPPGRATRSRAKRT